MARKIFLGRKLDAKKIIRHWMVGHQSVSTLSDGGRHRKAQTLPLSGMAEVIRKRSGNGSRRQTHRRKYGCGKEVQSNTHSVEASGAEEILD